MSIWFISIRRKDRLKEPTQCRKKKTLNIYIWCMSCFYTNDVHLKSKWIIIKLFILAVSGDETAGRVLIIHFIFSIAFIFSLTSVFFYNQKKTKHFYLNK